MKNNIFKFLLIILLISFEQTLVFADVFNFETKELQILEKGNILKANKGGKVITDEKVEIYANEFEYNKSKLTLIAIGDVKLVDEVNQLIINAEKIKLTGNKREKKIYYWHTGYPGGIKSRTAEKILDGNHPERVIEKAVTRMIPKGPLGRKVLKKLHIYSGTTHPHEAQNPVALDVAKLNENFDLHL